MESGVPEFRSRRMDPALLVCEGSPSNPKMNLQLLELSNKRATGNLVIHKSLVKSVLRKKISALSRRKYGFDPRMRCQILDLLADSSSGPIARRAVVNLLLFSGDWGGEHPEPGFAAAREQVYVVDSNGGGAMTRSRATSKQQPKVKAGKCPVGIAVWKHKWCLAMVREISWRGATLAIFSNAE